MLLNSYVFTGENKADLEGVKIQTGVLLNGTGIKKAPAEWQRLGLLKA